MKFYTDKDYLSYQDKEKEAKVRKLQKELDRHKRIFSAMLACHIVLTGMFAFSTTVSAKNKFYKDNPFDGQSISSSDFSANYKATKAISFLENKSLKEAKEYIENSNIDEKKAYILYYALLSNDKVEQLDVKTLNGYIQYFIDNKYLDDEYVYKKLSTLKCEFNPNVDGAYDRYTNTVSFRDEEAMATCKAHETMHSIDKSGEILNYDNYAWFLEGMTSVLAFEYMEANDGKDPKAYFIRILCEFVDPDVLLHVRATGNIDILVEALEKKGLLKDDIFELFSLINQYNKEYFVNKDVPASINIKIDLIQKLVESYNIINNNPNYISPLFWLYLENIEYPWDDEQNFYYFNTTKILQNPIPNFIRKNIFHEIAYNSNNEIIEVKQIDCKTIYEFHDDYEVIKYCENGIEKGTEKYFIDQADFKDKIDKMIGRLSAKVSKKNK